MALSLRAVLTVSCFIVSLTSVNGRFALRVSHVTLYFDLTFHCIFSWIKCMKCILLNTMNPNSGKAP